METYPTYEFGEKLIYNSPMKQGLKTKCLFIRHDPFTNRAVVMFANAVSVAKVDYNDLSKACSSVTKIESKTDGATNIETQKITKRKYEVVNRFWVASDGSFIREWTPDEYIVQNPEHTVILPLTIGDKTVNVEAHCVEHGNNLLYNGDNLIMKLAQVVNYPRKSR